MKHILFLAFLWIGLSFHAQIVNAETTASKADTFFLPRLTGEVYFREPEHIGEIFYNDKWTESTLLLSTGEEIGGEKIRYNGFLDAVIWLNMSSLSQYKLDKSYVNAFRFTNDSNLPIYFKRIDISDSTDREPKEIYVEVAVEDNISLYIQRRIIKCPDEIVEKESGRYSIRVYESAPVYYIKLPTNRYLKMSKLRRKSFLNLFHRQKESVSDLIRKNHINLRSERGLIEAIELMNKTSI
jgi:hypothetical protein